MKWLKLLVALESSRCVTHEDTDRQQAKQAGRRHVVRPEAHLGKFLAVAPCCWLGGAAENYERWRASGFFNESIVTIHCDPY